ncbi:Clustered mitochondria [Candida viswanathii]|uniref:Clustered mitochondria protein homolog n=1 Tax=Candida viswanathii TaxID=5486 RepID=A0A367Y3D3_9ASCO|nr:Clustered mitochondria [Candida viswanathii]
MSSEDKIEETAEQQQQPAPEPVKELTLKVQLPQFFNAQEDLTIPSNVEETVADLKQALNLVVVTRNLTNYSILIDSVDVVTTFGEGATFGQILDAFELSDAEELKIVIKEKAYNLASVYEQITRFREVIGLHYVDRVSTDVGTSGGVSKFNGIALDDVKAKEEQPEPKEGVEEEEGKASEISIPQEEVSKINEFAKTFTSRSFNGDFKTITQFDDITDKVKIPIKSLTISQWSPVPPFQQSKGDLLYLSLQTLEHETFNITCHFTGFFVNKSSTINFNPDMKVNEKGKFNESYLLYDLVSQLSPLFSKTTTENEVRLSESTPYPETYLLPGNSFPAYPWLVNESNCRNVPDLSRSQLPTITNGVDGSDYIKEWNNDIQSIKELPTSTIQERIIRDKLIQKSLFEFNKTATETAINIIKGNLSPLNPDETADRYIYLKNGIFYSTGTSTVDGFESTGGEEAARYVSSKDLSAIKLINRHDVRGISSLVTCIVDYMGKRIVCQAPVPGILDTTVAPAEHEEDEAPAEKVVYGLSSDGSKILEEKSFEEPLKQISELFHLKPHKVQLSEEVKSESDLIVSKDTKGLKGTDGRKYVIDLYRTTPRDVEFIEANFKLQDQDSYPHGEALIRHEAVTEWWRRKVAALFKEETEKLEKEGKLNKEGEEKPQIAIPTDQVVFNPDAFTNEFESSEDRDEVREISKFVKEKLIEEFLDEFKDQVLPFEGKQLTEVLHRSGINMRYLGYLADKIVARKEKYLAATEELIKVNEAEAEKKRKEEEEKAKQEAEKAKEGEEKKKEETEEAEEDTPTKATYQVTLANYLTLHRIVVLEMVARASKHVLRDLTKGVSGYLIPYVVAHFHNCLLGGDINNAPEVDIPHKSFYSQEELQFTQLTHENVVNLVTREVFVRFRYTLPQDWISTSVSLPQLLREIAVKYGIQWKSANYVFTKAAFDSQNEEIKVQVIETKSSSSKKSKKKSSAPVVTEKSVPRTSIFVADDIVSFIPLVKDSNYRSSVVEEIFSTARSHLVSGNTEMGIALFNELLAINESIYGKVNPETAKFYNLVAQVYQEVGHDVEAALLGRRAVILSERSCGFDSHETITTYMNAAYYESSNEQFLNSLKLYKQAVDIWTEVYGKDHPTLINTLTNVSDILIKIKSYDAAVQILEEALEITKSLNGEDSEVTGFIYFRLANIVVSMNKFKESKELFDKAYEIFIKLLGPDDSMTKQVAKYLSSVSLYVEYMNRQQQEAQKKAKTNGHGHAKVKAPIAAVTAGNVVGAGAGAKAGKKAKKQNTPPQPNPEIANQSVDEILKFIEGNSSSKSSKKSKTRK